MKLATQKAEVPSSGQSRRTVSADMRKKAALLLFSLAVLLGSGALAHAQSSGFDPNANGIIRAVAVQPDGKVLIGGDFTSLAPNGGATVTRNFIARLNPDCTLDTNFNPNASGEVAAIAVQADGKVLAGGSFTSIGGQTRYFLARLDATTGAADSFNPNPNSDVASITVQTNGKILAGGDFNQGNGTPSIGGATRNNMARLDPTTGLADSFNPNASSTVYAITVQTDGKVLAGGNFTSIGGQTRYGIAQIDPTTGLADPFAPNANGTVYAIALQADGKILAGGAFSGTGSVGGQTRNYIARLDPITGLADSFNPNANQQVNAIAVQPDGKILAGGNFAGSNSIGGQTRGHLARLDPVIGLADSFDPEANGPVLAIAVQADDKILAAGQLTTLAPSGGKAVARNHMARLATDGRLDQSFIVFVMDPNDPVSSGNVYATAIQPDGKILLGGDFMPIFGGTSSNLARLNTDGTVDTNFSPNANGTVYAIAVQPDGKVLVGGKFEGPNSINGQERYHLARLDAITGQPDSFDPISDDIVYSIAVQPDGKILVGGDFVAFTSGGTAITRNHIARIDGTTAAPDSFNPNANGDVYAIAVQADGNILAGGAFTGTNSIGGQSRTHIARLDPTTGLPDSFNTTLDNSPNAIVVQTDGQILLAGSFIFVSGQQRNHIARVGATNGAVDSTFAPDANAEVDSIALQADGKFLVAGGFTGFSPNGGMGIERSGIARLNANGTLDTAFSFDVSGLHGVTLQADGTVVGGGQDSLSRWGNNIGALRAITATQTAITWTCGGASPQFTRVTFESSTDNVNYSILGNGIPSGANWFLTGLNLPSGENLYIRARGYFRSGFQNGSESITESVRNVFLSPQLLLIIQLSGRTNVVLSWSTNFTGFTLESNANFSSNGWGAVLPAPSVSGANYAVTNAISGSTRFYRLSQ